MNRKSAEKTTQWQTLWFLMEKEASSEVETKIQENNSQAVGLNLNEGTDNMCPDQFQNCYGPVTAACYSLFFSFLNKVLKQSSNVCPTNVY